MHAELKALSAARGSNLLVLSDFSASAGFPNAGVLLQIDLGLTAFDLLNSPFDRVRGDSQCLTDECQSSPAQLNRFHCCPVPALKFGDGAFQLAKSRPDFED